MISIMIFIVIFVSAILDLAQRIYAKQTDTYVPYHNVRKVRNVRKPIWAHYVCRSIMATNADLLCPAGPF